MSGGRRKPLKTNVIKREQQQQKNFSISSSVLGCLFSLSLLLFAWDMVSYKANFER